MNLAFAAVARREYIRVGSAPASSAMDGANADQAGALIGPAGDGHCNEHHSAEEIRSLGKNELVLKLTHVYPVGAEVLFFPNPAKLKFSQQVRSEARERSW